MSKKYIVLRDCGGAIIGWILIGIPVGIVTDFFWNWFSLWISTRLIPGTKDEFRSQGSGYVILITFFGVLIDLFYFSWLWGTSWFRSGAVLGVPFRSLSLQLLLFLICITLLFGANFILCIFYLRVDARKSLRVAALMGFLTAPWLLVLVPYFLGWTK